jgi:hypothetical protein
MAKYAKEKEVPAVEQPIMKCGLRISDIQAVGNYLATRINHNCNGLQTYGKDDQWHDGPDQCRLYVPHNFYHNELGIFQHIVRKLDIEVEFYKLEKAEDSVGQRYLVYIHFHYTHPDGGSNGHEVGFKLWYNTHNHTLTEEITERD